jgi:hypothetical protein
MATFGFGMIFHIYEHRVTSGQLFYARTYGRWRDMFQGKQRGLVLFDRRSRLGNAPRKQVRLDGNFLVGQQADFGVEG